VHFVTPDGPPDLLKALGLPEGSREEDTERRLQEVIEAGFRLIDRRCTTSPVVALSCAAGAPVEVLRVGDFPHHGLHVDRQMLDHMAASHYGEIPVDYDHAFLRGGSSRAAGWITSLWREDDRLLADIDWTAQARQEIRDRQFRFFSSEISAGQLVAGTLTNRPGIDGLAPIVVPQSLSPYPAAPRGLPELKPENW
jgi:phage I-like protein